MFNDLLLSFAESRDTEPESGLLKGEVDVVERRTGNVERIIEIASESRVVRRSGREGLRECEMPENEMARVDRKETRTEVR
jgi:hypothetical protein